MNSTTTLSNVKPGDKIAFVTGPGYSSEYPSYQGIAYGKTISRWGTFIRVKITEDNGSVRFTEVASFTKVGIGAYYIGR